MNRTCDSVVIGAGPGGLAAAGVLAEEGRSVLVIDNNPRPGGTSRGFQSGGFTFPCGPLGFSNPRLFSSALKLDGGLEPGFARQHFSVRAFGSQVTVSLPFAALAVKLAELYPEETGGISEFFERAGEIVGILRSTPEGERPNMDEAAIAPASSVMDGLVEDPGLRRLLGSMGTCEPRWGYPLLARMWDLMSNVGIWYPEGGFDELVEGLSRRIEARGGEFLLGTPVTGITVNGGAATGVTLADGSQVAARAIVSNADFKNTFLTLLDERSQPPEWRAAVEAARLTASSLQVSIGVDAAAVDLSALENTSRMIYRSDEPGEAPDWSAWEVDPKALAGQETDVSLWSRDDGRDGPPGCAAVVLRVSADHAHFARFRPLRKVRSSRYFYYKARLGLALIDELEQVLPGLRRASRVIDIATPLTFEDRGARWNGAVAGWSQRHEDVPDYTVRPLVRTPVAGLYMAGHQAFSWLYHGGVASAVLSGVEAAGCALCEEGPISEVTIPACT